MDFDWDCIVVGAGPAGLSAALTLGRARRRVLVLDSGAPRNHAARAMHGVLGHDGLDPAALRERGRRGARPLRDRGARRRRRPGAGAGDRRRRRDRRRAGADADPRHRAAGRRRPRSTASTRSTGSAPTPARTATAGSIATSGSPSSRPSSAARTWAGCCASGRATSSSSPAAARRRRRRARPRWARSASPVVREPIERFAARDGRLEAIELTGRAPLPRDALFFHVGMRAAHRAGRRPGLRAGRGRLRDRRRARTARPASTASTPPATAPTRCRTSRWPPPTGRAPRSPSTCGWWGRGGCSRAPDGHGEALDLVVGVALEVPGRRRAAACCRPRRSRARRSRSSPGADASHVVRPAAPGALAERLAEPRVGPRGAAVDAHLDALDRAPARPRAALEHARARRRRTRSRVMKSGTPGGIVSERGSIRVTGAPGVAVGVVEPVADRLLVARRTARSAR